MKCARSDRKPPIDDDERSKFDDEIGRLRPIRWDQDTGLETTDKFGRQIQGDGTSTVR